MDPFERFNEVYALARRSGARQPDAMSLATVDAYGAPSVRMVLLKGVDPRGFVFYTNLASRKGGEILARPAVALCFFWEAIERQVRIEGVAGLVNAAEADAYFATRPRGSQIGAWASQQSRSLDHRDTLLRAVAEVEARYAGREVPRPDHWSGFRVLPSRIEFWHGQPDRLHERVEYTRAGDGWRESLLQP